MIQFPEAWKTKIIPHAIQHRLITEPYRFKTVPAGRRSGKTFQFKRHVVKQAMKVKGPYFAGAPVQGQAKKIFWNDLDDLIPKWYRSKQPNKTNMIFYLNNGSEIHVVGLDKPERIEGIPWQGGGIDEFGNCKAGTWGEHVRPALSTIGLNAWCWLFGVPEGMNEYYTLCKDAESGIDPDWMNYTWFSSDILPAHEITAAKRQLSPRQFRQEYEASFEGATGRVYADYTQKNHTKKVFDPGKPIHWMHDFNFVPLSSAICQIESKKKKINKGTINEKIINVDHIYCIDEIVLESAVAKNAAIEFIEKYKGYERVPVYLYGDASGRVGEKHNIESEYITIKKILQKAGFEVHERYPKANPSIKNGQNSLRAKILNADGERFLHVNPTKAKYCDEGLLTVQLKDGSAFQEKESKFQHITTALRYFTNVLWPVSGGLGIFEFDSGM